MRSAGKGITYTAGILVAVLLSGCNGFNQSMDQYIADHLRTDGEAPQEEEEAITITVRINGTEADPDNIGTLSWLNNTTLTLTVQDAAARFPGASYMWYADGADDLSDNDFNYDGTPNPNWTIKGVFTPELEIKVKGEFSCAEHRVTVRIRTADGALYAKSLTFRVE